MTLVVVLAGGEGRRMGGNKPLRRLAGETLIERALRKARSWSDDVRIGLRSAGQLPEVEVPLVLDDSAVEGPLSGLIAAFRASRSAGQAALLTMPCDMPFLPPDLLERLEEAIGDRLAAVASSDGRLHPVCALWRVEAAAQLPGYLATGGRSLRGFAEAVGFVAVEWRADALVNVNSPEELAAAQRRVASERQDVDRATR